MAVTRRYLLPCTGYQPAVRKAFAPPGALTADSREWLVSPIEGQLICRRGSNPVGVFPWVAGQKLVEFGTPVGRKIIELSSPSLADGYPTYSAIFQKEETDSAGADTQRQGVLYYRSTDAGGSNQQLGLEFGSTHYPVTASQSATWRYKVTPIPYLSANFSSVQGTLPTSALGMTRGSSLFNRLWFVGGARGEIQVGNWLYVPSLWAAPLMWNKRWNDSSSSGTEINRVRAWGHWPPLWTPTVATTTSTSTSDRNWQEGDSFYVTVMFQFEDGSFGMPVLPRPLPGASPLVSTGFITLGTTGKNYYRSIRYSSVPIGPDGTVARLILRTAKVNISTANGTPDSAGGGTFVGGQQTLQELDLSRLGIIDWIMDNTTVSYLDLNGNNNALDFDEEIVRTDLAWPPSARYAWEFDQRIAVGYTRPGLGAVVLAPTGDAGSRDLNAVDTSATIYGTKAFMYRLQDFDSTNLRLEIGYITYPSGDPSTTRTQINLHQSVPGTTLTVQDIIDNINGSLISDASKQWAAQIVPGANANAPSDMLACTVFDNVSGSGSSGQSILTIAFSGGHSTVDDVAIGMRVTSATAGIPASAVIIAKPAANQIQLGDPATGLAVNLTAPFSSTAITISITTGDDGLISGGTAQTAKYGWVRCWGQSSPGLLCFKGSYLDAFGKRERDVWFTSGGPGAPRIAPNSFTIGNRRSAPATAGVLMGGAPLNSGSVVCYSKAIYTLENRRDGSTGRDEDYFLYVLNSKRGCISPYSIVRGDGWVGYMTAEGYVVTDGRTERVITEALHNSASNQGVLSGAIQRCAANIAKDTDSFYISAMAARSKIHLCVADSASATSPTIRFIYDFSRGAEASGLAEVLGPGGVPYAWSAQLSNSYSVMGQVNDSSGINLYGVVDSDAIRPRMDQFDLGVMDLGKLITPGTPASWTIGGPVVASSGTFSKVAIGAQFGAITGISAGTTVLTKNAAETQLTVSPPITANSSGTPSIYGQEIEPIGYMAMDQAGQVRRRKSCQRGTAMYRNAEGTMTLQHSRDYARATAVTYTLAASTGDQAKQRVETNRAAGDCVEFAVSHDGRFTSTSNLPEFWGVEADVDILNSSG